MTARKAVRVLPEPVGAATRVERRWRINGHARAWAAVTAGNVWLNQALTAGWKPLRALSAGMGRFMQQVMRVGGPRCKYRLGISVD
ncbi:hypothetical protein D3C84_775610 [compost metagenome]